MSIRSFFTAAFAVAAVAAGSSGSAIAAAATNAATAGPHAQWAEMLNTEIQARLDGAAARLEIKASQQAVWNEYAGAVRALLEPPAAPRTGELDADAATLAHHRAEAMTMRAQKLTRVADATSKLQAALSGDQRQTLNQIVRSERNAFAMRHGWMHDPEGCFGEHEAMGLGAWHSGEGSEPHGPPEAGSRHGWHTHSDSGMTDAGHGAETHPESAPGSR